MRIEQSIAGGDIYIMDDQEIRDMVPPKALLAFLDDDSMVEITVRRAGTGFIAETYRKLDGPVAEMADSVRGATEATESYLSRRRW